MQATGRKEDRFRLFPLVMMAGFVLLAAGQVHLLLEVRRLKNDLADAGESQQSQEQTESEYFAHQRPQGASDSSRRTRSVPHTAAIPIQQIASLEQRLNDLARAVEHPPGVRAVAEYNVLNPPIGPQEAELEPPKRAWGQEQVTGPPDTPTAGDARTAWAPREQNAGPEWLQVDFDQPVDVAEVRIRETYNPGAISKVTGMVNGQEVVLWEGTATGGTAPRDFVVPVQGPLQANSIVVHLDTARVPGWNEIDAVELVGKDGARQWARSVNASSSYADGREPARRKQLEAMPMLSR